MNMHILARKQIRYEILVSLELDQNLAQNPVLQYKEDFKKVLDSFNNRRQIVQIALSHARNHKKVEYLGTDFGSNLGQRIMVHELSSVTLTLHTV
jgi:hypothetical protein